jgi:cobalt/nickel transport system ATP-binding protein
MAAIQVEGLQFHYPSGLAALAGATFQVEAGERDGLVGPNGAGKTTLFLCLAGVLAVRPGMVRLAGLDPTEPGQRRQLPAKVGIVFLPATTSSSMPRCSMTWPSDRLTWACRRRKCGRG